MVKAGWLMQLREMVSYLNVSTVRLTQYTVWENKMLLIITGSVT
jgi:hypothetical protein